jgi:hypothetical protein
MRRERNFRSCVHLLGRSLRKPITPIIGRYFGRYFDRRYFQVPNGLATLGMQTPMTELPQLTATNATEAMIS